MSGGDTRNPDAGEALALWRARWLAEASERLAESLDYERTLETVARLAMPEFGAWCIVDLIEGTEGHVRRIAVVHPDPDKQRLARELEDRYPPARNDPVGAPVVLRTREPELVTRHTDAMLVEAARDGRHLAILRALGMGSMMVVPMEAHGRLIGCMTFISADGARCYDREDLEVARHLATISALAVDSARQYRAADAARADALSFGLRARDSERSKSEFLSTMSHELRTPINAVLGYADLLAMGIDGPVTKGQLAHLERLREAGRHLLNLVNDVLDVAKADAGRLVVVREVADATDALRAARSIAFPLAAARGVNLTIEVAEEPAAASAFRYVGDRRRLEQIVINLVTNAIKFTPRGGAVHVRLIERLGARPNEAVPVSDEARRADGIVPRWIGIEVADTGIGIAPRDQSRVFEPFVQLASSRTRDHGGTGLGLTISRRLARMMGGDVTMSSGIGRGSTFTVWMHAAPPATAGEVAAMAPSLHTTDERRTSLRFTRGLFEIGDALLRNVDDTVLRYIERVRTDPQIPAAHTVPWTEIANHTATLLTDVAQALSVIEESAGAPSAVLRAGDDIRSIVADRHGAGRAQLGWSAAAFERDGEILDEEVRTTVRTVLPDDPIFPIDEGLEILSGLLNESRRIARAAFQRELALLRGDARGASPGPRTVVRGDTRASDDPG